jgi:hypothetical protein
VKNFLPKNTLIRYFYFSALIVIVTLAFYPGLSGNFFFDDYASIVENTTLKLFDGSFPSLIIASGNGIASPLGRPVSMASFALNLHYLGANPFYFKLINLLIHLINGGLVFVMARQIWQRMMGEKNSFTPALWVTAVWLLHPINLSPVLLVVQRMTSLAAFFTLAALCLYLYGRQTAGSRGRIAIATSLLICWPLGILSKETALLLPLFLLIFEWLLPNAARPIPTRLLRFIALALSIAIISTLVFKWEIIANGFAFRSFGPIERLLTEARVLWFYLLQLFLPWPDLFSLHHDDISISNGLLAPPQTLLAILAWVALIAIAIYRRHRSPLFTFAVVWYLAAHAIESTILPLEIAYEHRNYLASLGFLLWASSLLFPPQIQIKNNIPRLTFAASFVFFCALVTSLRADLWGDDYRRTQFEAMSHPNSARANYEAGATLVNKTFLSATGGNDFTYQTARYHFSRASQLDPKDKFALMGQLFLDCLTKKQKDTNLQIALRERFATTPFPPGDQGVVHLLSELLVNNRLCLDDAEVHALLDAALSNPAAKGKIRGMINAIAMDYAVAKNHDLPLGLTYARHAANSDPTDVPLRINLIRLLLATGNNTEALQQYHSLGSLRIAPKDKPDIDQIGFTLHDIEQRQSKP